MGNSFEIIQKLVESVDHYTQAHGKSEFSIEEFLVWLNSKVFSEDQDKSHSNHSEVQQVNMELSFLLIMQHRHFKSYTKKALADSALSSPDSFSFLYHLNMVGSYRKMELVKMHMMEAPSGIEVLKRLLAKEFIEEYDDPNDKRAKRVKITDKGIIELESCLPIMNQVFDQMTAEMSLSEKLHFIGALRDINDFHVANSKSFNV